MTVLFKEPTSAPLQEIEKAVSNGMFGNFNVTKITLLSSGKCGISGVSCYNELSSF